MILLFVRFILLFFLISSCFTIAVAQTYPTNLLWNGCRYTNDNFETADTLHCPKLAYKLVFEDNFDSTTLDLKMWQRFYPWGRSLHSQFSGTGWERQFYTDDNVSVKEGNLRLFTKVDPGFRSPEPSTHNIFFKYTSGMVFSVLNFTKGKFEARCKIPQIKGMFPAFWLYGFCAQEIDIFEFTNASKESNPTEDAGHLIMTYHRQNNCADTSKGSCSSGFTRNYKTDLSEDFHLYSVEWNEYKIVWKLDGKIAREVYRFWNVSPPGESLFGFASPIKNCSELQSAVKYSEFLPFPSLTNRMHIILNTAVLERGDEPGNLPQEFLIDYVRAYEEIEGSYVENNNWLNDFYIYPNPTDGVITIPSKIEGRDVVQIEVMNALDQQIHPRLILKNNIEFAYDLEEYPKGLYIVRVKAGEKIYLKKIIFY